MSKNNLHLAIEVSNAAEAGVNKLKTEAGQRGVNYLELPVQDEQHLFLYPINQNLSDALDEAGLELGTDEARFGLTWIDDVNQTITASELSKKIESVEFYNGTCQLFDMPQVIDFVDNNSEIVEQEKENLFGEDTSPQEETVQPEETDDSQDYEDLDVPDSFSADGDFDLDIPDYFEDDTSDSQSNINDEVPEEDEFSKDELSSMFDEDESQEVQQSVQSEEDVEDKLLDAAINIFNKNTIGDELPSFDKKTQNLVNSDLVEANEHIDTARKNAILSIYNSLNDSNAREKAKAEDAELAQARKEHEKNIAQIKSNCRVKLDKLTEDEQQAYEDKKVQAGKVKLEEFYRDYDANHLHEVNELINHKSEPIKQEAESEIEAEDKSFDNYKNKVNEAIFNHVTENANVESAIKGFRKIVENEKDRLLSVIKKAENENTELKRKLDDANSALAINQQTYDSRVEADVAKKVNESTQGYKLQVEDAENRRRKEEKEKDDWKNRYYESQEELRNFRKEFQTLSTKVNNQIKVQEEVDKYKNQLGQQLSPQQQTPVIIHDNESNNKKVSSNDKSWKKYVGLAGIVAAAMALTGIFTATVVGSHQSQQAQTATTTVQSSTADATATSKDSDSTPDTFTYTTKDGKKYSVIKDDEHSGHYVDDKGVSHTVIFNAK